MLKHVIVYDDKICEPPTFFQMFEVTLNVYKSTLKWQNHITIHQNGIVCRQYAFNVLTDG